MSGGKTGRALLAALVALLLLALLRIPPFAPESAQYSEPAMASRETVVFWHFWGGADRAVVEHVVDRFNDSQNEFFVRAIAMPGNNLDLKIFLSVAGGDPPDVINQDDQIIGDWASRGALMPLDRIASGDEMDQLRSWLLPAARELGTYDGRLFALCNGLDIRALYYNQSWLDEAGKEPPQTLGELDRIAVELSQRDSDGRLLRVGYLPDSRRLWAWGIVFGGDFFNERTQTITPDHPRVVAALEWMSGYASQFGAMEIAAFRRGDQSLPGAAFPLLPLSDSTKGRYAVLMDGQWRVRDIAAWQTARTEAGESNVEFGVCPLPPPAGGRENAGWVNGNFFIIPRTARNPRGAWEFMKFWSGFGGNEHQAARTCVAGGWLPVSDRVIEDPLFQNWLEEQPLFAEFVALSQSPYQVPIPVIPAAPAYRRAVDEAAERALARDRRSPRELLENVRRRMQPLVSRRLESH